ncbi:restriction endonuclease subunit S [Microcystis aeruginosa]|uniref:restriction endonuclease subunit S n=1 Tax=Microcystis aeruginosa TaxID=1126 RepID=UPI00287FA36C|nr:restriction endonuclease subunit S [Microcystis aeruginosa]WNF16194.1 restriction endonuclease subunit S [Microcystis aeruginosa NRERC-214]
MTDSNSNYSDLPQGWRLVAIDDTGDYINGYAFKPSDWEEKGKPIIRIQNLTSDKPFNRTTKFIESKYHIVNGDILVSWSATLDAFIWKGEDAWLNQHIFKVVPNQKIVVKNFLFYLLKYEIHNLINSDRLHGSTMKHINRKPFLSHQILLPPLPEQHRIVEKIEELFSELDNGVASLKKALEQLKTYRQAVLKWAFEGKLTEKWRNTHQDSLEDGDTLLEQIKAERKRHYQQQLEDWKQALKEWENNGKETKKPTKPQQPKDLPPLTKEELSNLPSLPNGWVYVKAEEISHFITKGTTPSKDQLFDDSGDIPFLKVYNLTDNGKLDFSIKPTFVSLETHEGFLNRSKVLSGDVLMNIVGPPLGKVSLVSDKFKEWNINQAIVRYRVFDILLNKYLMYYLLSQVTIDRLSKRAKATAGQFNLTLEICRDAEIPMCLLQEQTQIVQEIESRLSVCDQLEATLTENLDKAEALRQSILKRAFEGKLVL